MLLKEAWSLHYTCVSFCHRLSVKASPITGNATDTLLSRLIRHAKWDFCTKTHVTDLHSDFWSRDIVLESFRDIRPRSIWRVFRNKWHRFAPKWLNGYTIDGNQWYQTCTEKTYLRYWNIRGRQDSFGTNIHAPIIDYEITQKRQLHFALCYLLPNLFLFILLYLIHFIFYLIDCETPCNKYKIYWFM